MLKIYSINKTTPNIRNSTIYRNTEWKSDEIVISRDSNYPLITFRNCTDDIMMNVSVNKSADLKLVGEMCRDYDHYDQINVYFANNYYSVGDCCLYDYCIFKPLVNLMINGSGSFINIENHKDNDKNHFLTNNLAFVSVVLNNLTLNGFNRAVINYGNCLCSFVNFTNNGVNYWVSEDYGGAIYNCGVLTLSNCVFVNNTAKYGGAIYNNGGYISFSPGCIFDGNDAYAHWWSTVNQFFLKM